MTSKPDLWMATPLPDSLRRRLSSAFNVVRPFESNQPERLLNETAPGLRFIVTGVPVLAGGVVCPIDSAYLAKFPAVEIVANMGVGVDNIDVLAAAERGIIVTNTPDVLTEETADAALGLLLCAVRQLPQADRYLRSGKWPEAPFRLTTSLRNRTMGIVGLGRIGKAIARRAEAFGLKVIYHGRRPQPDVALRYYADLEEMARACDILMIATPGGQETKNLIDSRILKALGPQGVLVNIARGEVVDEDALIAALKDGVILCAGLDVYKNEPIAPPELVAMEQLVLLPHVGSATETTRKAMEELVFDNLTSFLRGDGPLTPVAGK